jgi:SPP1 gp7 family putative phage head morphogenesis protein
MANRLERLRKNVQVKGSIDAVFLRNKTLTGANEEELSREPYKKSDLVYICISTTAKSISQVPLVVSKMINKREEYRPVPTSDPWQQLFFKPNYITDGYTFTESIVTHLLHDGEVFIIPFPPGMSPPQSLWVVRNKFVSPIKDEKYNRLLGWVYDPSGRVRDGGPVPTTGVVPLNIDEIARVFLFNPYDPLKGMAPLEAGKLNVVVDYKAAFYTSVFFDEGAVPGGVLSTEQRLGDKQFNRTKEQFESRHQGYRRSHRVAVLEQGLRYTQTGLSQKDMEFSDLRKLTAERIYQIFGMKKAIVSVTEDVNYATSKEQRKEWWEGTNLPLMSMATSALNFLLFPQSDLKVDFDTTTIAALKDALKDKVDTGHKLWLMGFTANEVNQRLDLGFGSKPWRDVWYVPVNLMPVEQALEPPDNPPALEPAPEPPKALPPAPERIIHLDETKEDARGESIWNNLVRRAAPLEESFSKKVSRVFSDMRKKTLELLYKGEKSPKDVEDEFFSDDGKNLEKFTDPLYREAILVGVSTIIDETGLGIAFDITNPESMSFLMGKKLKIRGVIQTVKDQIQLELTAGYQAGESIDQIADRIRNVFNVSKNRARSIARTEIIGAANEGRSIAINTSGYKKKRWWTALDEKVRKPQHTSMHGVIVNVGEAWVFPDGTSVRHPGDYTGPAHQIINCRCIEMVVPGTHYLLNS